MTLVKKSRHRVCPLDKQLSQIPLYTIIEAYIMPPIRVLIVYPNTKGIFCDIKSWIIIVAAHIKNIDANARFPAFNAFCFTHFSYAATVFKVSFIYSLTVTVKITTTQTGNPRIIAPDMECPMQFARFDRLENFNDLALRTIES